MSPAIRRTLGALILVVAACSKSEGAGTAQPPATVPQTASPATPTPADPSSGIEGRTLAITGVWQEIPEFASGWTDAYQFYADGRFVFHSSEMDCATRLDSYSGNWRIVDSVLVLVTKTRVTREGGHYEEALGSCGTDSALVDSKDRKSILARPETTSVAYLAPAVVQGRVHSFTVDTMILTPAVGMRLGTGWWYKMREDPSAYP